MRWSVRATGRTFVKVGAKANQRRVLTIKGLKRNTRYEIKIVNVRAGMQSAASKTLTVTTRK